MTTINASTAAQVSVTGSAPREREMTWSPIGEGERLTFSGTSLRAVEAALAKAFGPLPLRLERPTAEKVLLGMTAAAGDGAKPYESLLAALRKFGAIEVKTS